MGIGLSGASYLGPRSVPPDPSSPAPDPPLVGAAVGVDGAVDGVALPWTVSVGSLVAAGNSGLDPVPDAPCVVADVGAADVVDVSDEGLSDVEDCC